MGSGGQCGDDEIEVYGFDMAGFGEHGYDNILVLLVEWIDWNRKGQTEFMVTSSAPEHSRTLSGKEDVNSLMGSGTTS